MTFWHNFNTNLGNYSAAGSAIIDHDVGDPMYGCVKMVAVGLAQGGPSNGDILDITDTYTLTGAAPTCYFNCRVTANNNMDWWMYPIYIRVEGTHPTFGAYSKDAYFIAAGWGLDSGWIQRSFVLTGFPAGTVLSLIRIVAHTPGTAPDTGGSDYTTNVWFDSLTIDTPPDHVPGGVTRPDVTCRLWIYKSIDGGKTWISRGIQTP